MRADPESRDYLVLSPHLGIPGSMRSLSSGRALRGPVGTAPE
jgi:hypothetical protein